MRIRKIDPVTGDMMFGHGQADFWHDQPEGVAQLVMSRLQLWKGQWFLDVTEGTPWQTSVLGKYTAAIRDQAIRARILGTTGVTAITAYSSQFDPDTRKFNIQATISTLYGVATIAGPI